MKLIYSPHFWSLLHLCTALFSLHANSSESVRNFDYTAQGVKEQKISYEGVDFTFYDNARSETIDIVAREIRENSYPLNQYKFKKGDVIIDIGAHVGIISVILAKLNPDITIYAFEACPSNFLNLQRNIMANQISNIQTFNLAVTGKSGDIVDIYDLSVLLNNSGSSSTLVPLLYNHYKDSIRKFSVITIALDEIFSLLNIQKCSLLKIDCEGSEYDVLLNSEKFKTGIVEEMVGEFHINNTLANKGYSREKLLEYCRQHVKNGVRVDFNGIHD